MAPISTLLYGPTQPARLLSKPQVSHPAAGLTIQLLLFPESGREEGGTGKRAPQLPKVSVTDDVFALRRAFQEAERMGQQQAQKEIRKAQQSGDESD